MRIDQCCRCSNTSATNVNLGGLITKRLCRECSIEFDAWGLGRPEWTRLRKTRMGWEAKFAMKSG